MKTQPRVSTMDIPVPMPVFVALWEHRKKMGCKQELFEMAGAAVSDWLAARERESSPQTARQSLNGYQWKELFLPVGTILRTVFQGQNYHATVDGDRIRFEGRDVSPSQFVNSFGGAVRNAWKVTWLLFPGETAWKQASTVRERPQ